MSQRMRAQAAMTFLMSLAVVMAGLLLCVPFAHAEEYEVLPHQAETRAQVWASEGFSYVASDNQSGGNRFRLGFDFRLGPYSRFEIGWTILDVITSGESSASVGGITRDGSGPNFGYYILPDKLWARYTFNIQSVKGSRVSGSVTAYGHQLGVGYVIWSNRMVNISGIADYLYVPSVSVPVLDVNLNNSIGNANYPTAHIWTLSLAIGFDFG